VGSRIKRKKPRNWFLQDSTSGSMSSEGKQVRGCQWEKCETIQ